MVERELMEKQPKNWKEKLVNLPAIGWFIGLIFRWIGIKVNS